MDLRVRTRSVRRSPGGRKTRGGPAFLLVFFALAGLSCRPGSRPPESPGTISPPRHVILVTVDTLRADHTSAYGYPRKTTPFLDELAQSGRLFEHPIVQWPKTGASFASMFTGRYPQSTGLTHKAALNLPADYLTLAEFMKSRGFTTLAVVSNAVLASRLGWSQGFDEYVETWAEAEAFPKDPYEYRQWMNAARVNELALPLLHRFRAAERLFVWLHYSDPHTPYVLPPGVSNPFLNDDHYTGREEVAGRHLKDRALGQHRELRYYVAQYDANVLVADGAIEEALDYARRLGILEDCLVIYTSDHGESLGEHGSYFNHGPLPYNTTARVPLVLWAPHHFHRGRRIPAAVELVDLYPTLEAWLAPQSQLTELEGESLLPLVFGDKTPPPTATLSRRYAFSESGRRGNPTTHFRSLQDGSWKLIYHPALERRGATRPPRYELYHLDQDPLETVNLAAERPEPMAVLRRELRRRASEEPPTPALQGTEEEKSEDTRRALRALGYVE